MLGGSIRDVEIHHRSTPSHRRCIRINAAAFEEGVYCMQFSSSSVPLQSVWEETSTFPVLMLLPREQMCRFRIRAPLSNLESWTEISLIYSIAIFNRDCLHVPEAAGAADAPPLLKRDATLARQSITPPPGHVCRYRPVTQTALSLILLKLGERGGRRESKEGKELRKSGSLSAVLAKLL